MLLGALMVLCGMLAIPGDPSQVRAVKQMWPVMGGYSAMFAAIVVMVQRIAKIFFNGKAARLRLTDRHLLRPWAILVGIQMGLLTIYTSPTPESTGVKHVSAVYRYKDAPHFCDDIPIPTTSVSSSVVHLLCILYVNVLAMAAVISAFRIRHVPAHFKETKMIMIVSSEMLALVVILIPVRLPVLVPSRVTRDFIFVITWWSSTVLFVGVIQFLPKLLHVIEILHLSSYSGLISSADAAQSGRTSENKRGSAVKKSTESGSETETRADTETETQNTKRMRDEMSVMSMKLAKMTEMVLRISNLHAGSYTRGGTGRRSG